jgi:hypothetical protein
MFLNMTQQYAVRGHLSEGCDNVHFRLIRLLRCVKVGALNKASAKSAKYACGACRQPIARHASHFGKCADLLLVVRRARIFEVHLIAEVRSIRIQFGLRCDVLYTTV